MKIAFYSARDYEKKFIENANDSKHEFLFIRETLTIESTGLCKGCDGVALFTSDDASANVLYALKENGVNFIVTRSAGFDHIDLAVATALNIQVANVPAYSPNAIAEHTVAMMLALARKLVLADKKIKE